MHLILFLIFFTDLFYVLNKLPEMFEFQYLYLFKGREREEALEKNALLSPTTE